MSSWIRVGQQCICLKASTQCWDMAGEKQPISLYGLVAPAKGEIVTIRKIEQKRCGIAIMFEEFDNRRVETHQGGEVGFDPRNFKPLVSVSQADELSLFTSLLNPAKTEVTA